MPEIVITVRPDGSTLVETRGFAGAACQPASRFLEDALGDRSSEQLTSEFFATSVAHTGLPQSH